MYLRGPSGPGYMDSIGRVISTVQCGSAITFDVPGYSQVWLDQTHNGSPGYSGVFPVPMQAYTPNCQGEVGSWANTVYTVTPNGQRGTLIGSNVLQVTPQMSAGGPPATGTIPTLPFSCPPGFYVTEDAQSHLPACASNASFVPSGAGTKAPPATTSSSWVPPNVVTSIDVPQPVTPAAPASSSSDGLLTLAAVGLGLFLLGRSGRRN